MDKRVVRTIHGAHLATHMAIGVNYVPEEHTTLNEKFGIMDKERPVPGEFPRIAYLAIGRGGSEMKSSTAGCPYPSQKIHSPEDAALFSHIPFIVRKIGEDLSNEQRKGYRMRVPFTGKDGEAYVAYYLKVIDLGRVKPQMELRHVENGKITSTLYETSPSNLSPVAVKPSNIDKNNPNGDYLVSTAKLLVSLDLDDLSEIRKAYEILDGECGDVVINEIALVSGIDRQVAANIGGLQSNYIEAIAAQINTFLYKYSIVDSTSTSLDYAFDIGSGEYLHLDKK